MELPLNNGMIQQFLWPLLQWINTVVIHLKILNIDMKYYPILLSKAGELSALSQLAADVKSDTAPVFQVLSGALERMEAHLIENWAFEGNRVLLDFSLFEDVDGQIAEVEQFFRALFHEGVDAVPV
ncbi:MAG: hypothetical protein EOP49_20570, partial [Sphingobacteriales bacterium]